MRAGFPGLVLVTLLALSQASEPYCGSSIKPLVNMHFADNALHHVSGSNCCTSQIDPSPATVHECCSRCSNNQDCDGWIWQPSSNKCWLVGARGDALVPFPTQDKVSGVIPRNRPSTRKPFTFQRTLTNDTDIILRDRLELPALLNQQQPSGLGIILGVGEGSFALHLLENWPGGGLYLCDPYVHMTKGYENDPSNLSDRDHQLVYERLRSEIYQRGYEQRHTFMRDFSYSFAKLWISKRLAQPNFVYIDNNHSYLSVKRDLEDWWPILAPSGLIAGSSYTGETKRAVDEFFGKKGVKLMFMADRGWLAFK